MSLPGSSTADTPQKGTLNKRRAIETKEVAVFFYIIAIPIRPRTCGVGQHVGMVRLAQPQQHAGVQTVPLGHVEYIGEGLDLPPDLLHGAVEEVAGYVVARAELRPLRAVVVGICDGGGFDPAPLRGGGLGHVKAEHEDGEVVEEVHQARVGREVTEFRKGGGGVGW